MLFNKITIGNLQLKNRIVMPALDLGFCPDGQVNDRLINFYQERARGGAALIMIGGTAIEASEVYGGFVSIHDDSFIVGHKKLVATVKEQGAHIGIQLFHAGRYSFAYTRGHEIVAPSAIPSRLNRQMPRQLTLENIQTIIKHFGDAASRAQQAGYDLIEVISSAGYLISQFLSPISNTRTDKYGGSLENRMRFGLEIIAEIRRRVGVDMPLSVRLGGSDFMPKGNTWREMSIFARELEKASVNLLNVTGGWHESNIPQIQAEVPRGGYAYLANQIKQSVNIPVAASNRINHPQIAEDILQNRQADLVSVGRGFLADPEWGVKAQAGRENNIRRCIGCMTCLDKVFDNDTNDKSIYCAINPQCGWETKRTISPADIPLKILIIGAGPAGLEAARAAALKGHKVSIWEKSDRIGGQWNLAAKPPAKKELGSLVSFYKEELAALGVEILLNHPADKAAVQKSPADVILVASGAVPVTPPIPASQDSVVLNAWEVLDGAPVTGREIAVVGGGSVGCETALYLAEKGTIDAETLRFMLLHGSEDPDDIYTMLTRGNFRVSLVEMGSSLAADMGKTIRWTVLKQLQTMGVKVFKNTTVKEITTEGILVSKAGQKSLIKADTVVMAVGSMPETSLYEELKKELPRVYLLGDASGPAKVKDAIHSSFDLVNNL